MNPAAAKFFPASSAAAGPLVVIPCLNEVGHIAGLLRQFRRAQQKLGGRIVVVDGGSTDGTIEIVKGFTRKNSFVELLHNPDRIQSAAINLAVEVFGDTARYLIRVDAHCRYPDDYCQRLLEEAAAIDAGGIVVSMAAEGGPVFQRINAAAQNSTMGNGGSKHRMKPSGEFVDHGHHALLKLDAFRAVGGYDPGFTHNEDAELDFRLRRAGYRIWLTPKTIVTYYPRKTVAALGRQYFNFGKGRAQNLLKHRELPKLRQTKVMLVLPAVVLAVFLNTHWVFAVPVTLWAIYCLTAGAAISVQERKLQLALSGFSAMLMHLAWSLGFWQKILLNSRSVLEGQTA